MGVVIFKDEVLGLIENIVQTPTIISAEKMWSFFSRDPSKDFNYEIGDPVSGLGDKSIWKLHKAKKKVSQSWTVIRPTLHSDQFLTSR